MNLDPETENRGANIQPSARKSIHSHCKNCPYTRIEGMGKYGIGNKNKNRILERSHPQNTSTSKEDQGIDEVDNIMSKFAHPTSPKAATRKARRNSVDTLNHYRYSNESDDDNFLSKSTPAILQSHSHCRDESDESPELNHLEEDGHNSSQSLIYATPLRVGINESEISNRLNVSPYITHANTNVSQRLLLENDTNTGKGARYVQFLLVLIIAVIASLVTYYGDNFNISYKLNDVIYDETKFHNDVTYLGEKYKVTDNSILQIQTGISTIFQRQDTGSFIFAYNSQNSNFNPILFNNFINEIAFAAARYLRNDSNVQNHVLVDSSKLNMRVHSELIEKYRDDVTKTGVMVVKDLDDVPSTLAMAFHYYCDEFNPLIKRSAIFFTLNMARCSDQKTSHASIEKCLAKKWTVVPKDNIVPLLTRVVSIVVDVTSAF